MSFKTKPGERVLRSDMRDLEVIVRKRFDLPEPRRVSSVWARIDRELDDIELRINALVASHG